jgi:hypothetical protein
MNEVHSLAMLLRERHGGTKDTTTFTHVPSVLDATSVLTALQASTLADLVPAHGTPLTHPEQPWYVPVQSVLVDDEALVGVGVTASTWGPPAYDFVAGELVLRLIYANGDAIAQTEFRLYSREGRTSSLMRVFYDQQRAATGYEGEDQLVAEPTPDQVSEFIALVREATGVE